jgi:hypothetical protein
VQNNSNTSLLSLTINLALFIFFIITFWKVFSKAGKPGWASLIPIYNLYVILKIANKPGWWLILYFIPIVNLFVYIFSSVSIAKMFGKGTFFGIVMLVFLGFIGYPMLAFGKSKYLGGNTQINQPPSPATNINNSNIPVQPVQNEIPTVQPNSPQPISQQPLNQQSPTQQNPIPQSVNEIPSSEIKFN